jgi:hypothetical protein
MSIALRNKYLLALIIMALLTLFVLSFVMLSTVAHIDVWHSIGALYPHG